MAVEPEPSPHESPTLPSELPVLPLRGTVAFPLAVIPLVWILWTVVSQGVHLLLESKWWTHSQRGITSRYPAVHWAPVHVGDPAALGIADLSRPDFGDPVEVRDGEVPVFWACGVTPQAAVMESRPPLAIAHAPGHMLVTDARDSDYLVP